MLKAGALRCLALLVLLAGPVAAAAPQLPLPLQISAADAELIEREGLERSRLTVRAMRGWEASHVQVALKAALADVTRVIYQRGHGVYVEYTMADGKLLMWYPGNRRLVEGIWAVRDVEGLPRACFSYRNAVNPVTHVFNPTECVNPVQTLAESGTIARGIGDVFGLSANGLPFAKAAMDVPAWPEGAPPPSETWMLAGWDQLPGAANPR